MATLVKDDARVKRMAQLEDLFRMDPDLLEDYLDQERAHWDYVTNVELIANENLAKGRAEGRAEGEERGREEALFATARRMKLGGMSDAQIMEFTDLPLAEIQAL